MKGEVRFKAGLRVGRGCIEISNEGERFTLCSPLVPVKVEEIFVVVAAAEVGAFSWPLHCCRCLRDFVAVWNTFIRDRYTFETLSRKITFKTKPLVIPLLDRFLGCSCQAHDELTCKKDKYKGEVCNISDPHCAVQQQRDKRALEEYSCVFVMNKVTALMTLAMLLLLDTLWTTSMCKGWLVVLRKAWCSWSTAQPRFPLQSLTMILPL